MPGAKACCELPVLALDVVDDGRARPGQQRGYNKADALTRAGRREAQHMLRTLMAQIVIPELAKHDAVRAKQTGGFNLILFRPTR